MYIDAHVHVWTDEWERYPLAPGRTRESVRPAAFRPEDLLAHCRPCGVERVVLVQPSFYGLDHSYLLDVMRAHPGVFSGIALIDVGQVSSLEDGMLRLAKEGVRGFRITPQGAPPEEWLKTPGYRRLFEVAGRHRLAICPLIDPPYLVSLKWACTHFPETLVIVDHLGRIGADGTIRQEDVARLCALARFPNVMVKVSAFYALGRKQPPYEDLVPFIHQVYEAFGPDRLMWGSDCPYQVMHGTYADSLGLVRDRLSFLSEADRRCILHDTAANVFFPDG